MTLLTICQDAADELKISRPSAVVGSSQTDSQLLFRYANRVGLRLMKSVAWQAIRMEKTFTGLAGETQTGILPADFDRFVPETFWDRTNVHLVTGPIGAVQWQGLKANSYSDDTRPKFIYRGSDVLIIPALGGGESLAFEYVSQNWAQSSGGTGRAKFQADTDTALLSEELITLGVKLLYLTDDGQPNATAQADFEDYLNNLIQNDQPGAGILLAADIFGGGRHFSGAPSVDGNSV
jgi:hypothetical protein